MKAINNANTHTHTSTRGPEHAALDVAMGAGCGQSWEGAAVFYTLSHEISTRTIPAARRTARCPAVPAITHLSEPPRSGPCPAAREEAAGSPQPRGDAPGPGMLRSAARESESCGRAAR